MKKTISVNLNGISFQIDEDAYQRLETYLNEIGEHYHKSDEQEIIQDIEARLAEIFQDTQQKAHKEVIDLQDVNLAIEQLGHPEQFEEEDNNASSAEGGTSENDNTTSEEGKDNAPKVKKKLYRNPDNQIISGVSSGLAAFLGCTPLLIRLLWVILFFIGYGFTLLAYLLMWIIIPEANTPSKRLEMQGIEVNIDTLKRQKEAEEAAGGKKHSSGTVGKTLLILLCALICFPFLIAIFAILIGIIAAIFGLTGWGLAGLGWDGLGLGFLPLAIESGMFPSGWFLVGTILCLLCPLIALIVLIVHLVQANKNEDTHSKRKIATYITLLILWVVGIILVHTQNGWWDNEGYRQQVYQMTDSITQDAMQQAQNAILFSDSIAGATLQGASQIAGTAAAIDQSIDKYEDAIEQAADQLEEQWDQAEEEIENHFD